MTLAQKISIFIFALISLIAPQQANAQEKIIESEGADTIALFRGVSVSVDAVGPLMMYLGDYGQYEAALRVNLKDKYFPVFELGYGMAKHDEDIVTELSAKTNAPYFRVGCDFNIAKHKHDGYRIYAGLRYAFTSYTFELNHPGLVDPVWGEKEPISISEKCNFHWAEIVFGVDAKIAGPFRLGWSVRYRSRLASNDGNIGKTWYVPGFGKNDSSTLGGTFNLIFEL